MTPCIGDSAWDTPVEGPESCATAALARIRERNRLRQSVLDPCGLQATVMFLGEYFIAGIPNIPNIWLGIPASPKNHLEVRLAG